MDAAFIETDEQTMLRDSVRRWVVTRDVREREDGAAAWAYGVEQGWLMAGLPEDAGGLGGAARDSGIIAEELGRGLVRSGFVEAGMVGAHLMLAIDADRAAAVAMGETRPILAHDEAAMRGDDLRLATRAVRDGDGWRLTGRKTAIVGEATALVVSARLPDDTLGLFELTTEAAPLRRYVTVDDRPAAELRLDATAATLLLDGAAAERALAAAVDRALVLESAEALGAMQGAFDLTREYLAVRRQYGRLIGEFQALRHRLADMFIELEQARSILTLGLSALDDADVGHRGRLAAATRARVAQAGLYVGGQAIQLHGGIGVTDEYPVGHYYKRLVAFAARHGGEARQVERFAVYSAARA